jgi:signal transduction histidine kinase
MSPSIDANAIVTAMGTKAVGRATESRQHANLELLTGERRLRMEERRKERARIAQDLHDTLFQGFFGASMVLHNVVDAMPENSADKQSLGKALQVVRRVLEEGRAVLQGLRMPAFAPASIERELSGFLEDLTPSGVHSEISVTGTPKQVGAEVQEQVNLIGREALTNALLHSGAAHIEVEVEYSARRLRVIVRDDGRGIDPETARSRQDSHWGLVGMRERAASIGAALAVWSRPGAGTEVEISVPCQALTGACA